MSPRTLIYARRSCDRDDHQALSIEQQLDVLRDVAAKRGIDVDQELVESASAREPGRPVFSNLMKLIRAGKAERVLVWRPDRLARNMVDGGALIYELQQGKLKEIVTPEATYTATGDAKFMLAMLFGAAAKFTDDLSAAIRRGNADVLKKGKVPGPVPLGYLKTHEHELVPGAGTVIPDPERFDTVKRIWTEVATGNATVTDVWKKARYEWGLTTRPTKGRLARPIGVSYLYALLRNPFYAGDVHRGSTVARGEHAPMVTRADFDRVQERFVGQHTSSRPEPDRFLYHGLLRCGHCRRALIGEQHTRLSGRTYTYYRCGRRRVGFLMCAAPPVREDHLTEQLGVLLDRITVAADVRGWAHDAIASWSPDVPSPENDVRRAKAALARAERGLVTLTDLLLDGLVSDVEYKVRRMNLVARIDHLREALAAPAERLAAWRTAQRSVRERGLRLGDDFRTGDVAAKRRVIQRVSATLLVKNRMPQLELRAPFTDAPQRASDNFSTAEHRDEAMIKDDNLVP